ncbi:MAG TPA: hypothetical protein VF928_08970 [Usitatibacteraceae bacterium]
MELYLQRRSPAGNFAGLATVIALHLAIGLALLYGLARNDVRIFTPPDVAYISPDIVKPPQPTVNRRRSAASCRRCPRFRCRNSRRLSLNRRRRPPVSMHRHRLLLPVPS